MVKVITIRDDVYERLFRLKQMKGMSFSEIIEYLLNKEDKPGKNLLEFAGILTGEIDERRLVTLRRWLRGKDLLG